jgi:serine/threonine-protein kinase HipA
MSPSLKPVRVDLDTAAALVSGAPDETDADRVEHALRLTRSLGGARPKAYVYLKNGKFSTGEADGEAWIVKFPAKHDGREAGAVEYAYSLMAAAAGIDTPPAALLPSQDGPGFFAIKRFDRQLSGRRLHMHSFAGLLNATASHNGLGYTELMRVTGALTHKSGTAASSIEEQIRRMAFNVLARNRDDHAKNHAFLMDENGTWRCAPAFDLTYANDSEHALLVGSQGREPTTEDMLSVAREMHVPDDRAKSIIAQVRSAVGDWNRFAAQAGLSAALTADIDHSLNGGGSPDGMSAAFHFINRTGGIGS